MSKASGSNTPKFRAFRTEIDLLATSCKDHLPRVATILFGKSLITGPHSEEATNATQPTYDRSSAVMRRILTKIEEDEANYDIFFSELSKISALEGTIKKMEEALKEAELPNEQSEDCTSLTPEKDSGFQRAESSAIDGDEVVTDGVASEQPKAKDPKQSSDAEACAQSTPVFVPSSTASPSPTVSSSGITEPYDYPTNRDSDLEELTHSIPSSDDGTRSSLILNGGGGTYEQLTSMQGLCDAKFEELENGLEDVEPTARAAIAKKLHSLKKTFTLGMEMLKEEKKKELAMKDEELAVKDKELAMKDKELAMKNEELAMKDHELADKRQKQAQDSVMESVQTLQEFEKEMKKLALH